MCQTCEISFTFFRVFATKTPGSKPCEVQDKAYSEVVSGLTLVVQAFLKKRMETAGTVEMTRQVVSR